MLNAVAGLAVLVHPSMPTLVGYNCGTPCAIFAQQAYALDQPFVLLSSTVIPAGQPAATSVLPCEGAGTAVTGTLRMDASHTVPHELCAQLHLGALALAPCARHRMSVCRHLQVGARHCVGRSGREGNVTFSIEGLYGCLFIADRLCTHALESYISYRSVSRP